MAEEPENEEQKFAGIILDDYKIPKFTAELNKAGFTDIEVFSNSDKTSLLKIPIHPNQQKEIGRICAKCEIDLKHSN